MTHAQSLSRFLEAQADPTSGFEVALRELQSGRKTSHWIWYVLPQLAGLGRSSTAKFYGLADGQEARAYLQDPVLGARLQMAVGVIREQLEKGIPVTDFLGGTTDSQKLASCLTLFEIVARPLKNSHQPLTYAAFSQNIEAIFKQLEAQGYSRCAATLDAAKAEA